MEAQMTVAMIFALINIVLLSGIIVLNLKSYMRIKAEYTLFMILFAGMFLVQYVMGAYFYFTNMSLYPGEIATHMMALTMVQTVAFVYMLWMEWQ
ncbi:hypothetical protein GOV11_00290, partial [Candidatus Woesearchaeota archaeon]|nr:hypothetical protein [Candidatus Woesearchaeota archaeon]